MHSSKCNSKNSNNFSQTNRRLDLKNEKLRKKRLKMRRVNRRLVSTQQTQSRNSQSISKSGGNDSTLINETISDLTLIGDSNSNSKSESQFGSISSQRIESQPLVTGIKSSGEAKTKDSSEIKGNEKKQNRKRVRFDEKTVFINDLNQKSRDEANEKPEKSHLTLSIKTKFNTKFNTKFDIKLDTKFNTNFNTKFVTKFDSKFDTNILTINDTNFDIIYLVFNQTFYYI